MRFVAATIAFIAVFAIGVTPALARFVDPEKKYSVEFPAGWSKPVKVSDSYQSDAPGGTGVFCRTNSVRMKSLDAYTQAKINTTYGQPLDQATWAGVIQIDPAKLTILDRGAKVVDGHIVQSITMRLTADVMGRELTVRYATHILVGRMVNAMCFASPQNFDAQKATFERIVTSQKPL